MSVSALDHRRFTHGTSKEQLEYATELTQSLKSHSFVKIINHGLDDGTIDELFERVCLLPLLILFSSTICIMLKLIYMN